MKLLYLGDIMADPGIKVVEKLLPALKKDLSPDIIVAQAENVSNGKGISLADFNMLTALGIDFFTGGNHSLYLDDIEPAMNDPKSPIIRPANYPEGAPGLGYKIVDTKFGKVLFISLLGQVVGKDANKPVDNPLKVVDSILEQDESKKCFARVVNFHGDYSSEKLVIGYYLDGRVSAVIGDHWHIASADAMVLPKGTAHITDVGMCGSLHSSLGVKTDIIIDRWRDGRVAKNEIETKGDLQLNAVLVDVGGDGLSKSIKLIRKIVK